MSSDPLVAENARLRRKVVMLESLVRDLMRAAETDRTAEERNGLLAQLRRHKAESVEWKERARENLVTRINIQTDRDRLAEELQHLRPRHP